MVNAAVYCRISQDRVGEALGVARQEEDCRGLAEDKGWSVAEVYVDNDVSATSSKARPQYQRMIADIEGGRINAVVVWDVDRLTRKPRELEDWIDFADRHQLQLASVGGEIDLATPQGRLTARIKGSVARHEAEQTSRRVKAKHEEKARMGLPSGGGTRPYGFEEDRVTHRPEEAEVVREVARHLLNGGTLRGTCRVLNERGDLTTTGRSWSTNTLKKMVLRPRTAGFREHHGELVKAVWEPILDPLTWEQLRMDLGAHERRTTTTFQRQHHWTGLLTCARCGGLMGARTVSGRLSYGCRSMHHNRWDARANSCQGVSIRKTETDNALDELLLQTIEGESLGHIQPDDRTAALEREEVALMKRLDVLAEAFAGDGDTLAYKAASRKIAERLDLVHEQLERSRTRTQARHRVDPATVRAEWPQMEPKDRRLLAGVYIARVLVSPATRRGDNRFDAGRLLPEWL